jgi:hypothetical protein
MSLIRGCADACYPLDKSRSVSSTPKSEIDEFGTVHLLWRLEHAAYIQHTFRKRPREIH